MIKVFIKILIYSISFTVVIFFIDYNFFSGKIIEENIEQNIAIENYIDYEVKDIVSTLKNKQKKEIKKYFLNKKNKNIFYSYDSTNIQINSKEIRLDINNLLDITIFNNKIKNIYINFFENKTDRRGTMKNKHIKLFGYTKEKNNEYLSVFIHELGHYIDLYFFEKKVFVDISDRFYNISWQSTKIKHKGQKKEDFISGYAMTNKYEDFAESFNFYILHNKEFLKKTKKSNILKQKYDFFSDYLFKNKQFFASNFSVQKYKSYYWDSTKIPFDKEKLFNYLKKQ